MGGSSIQSSRRAVSPCGTCSRVARSWGPRAARGMAVIVYAVPHQVTHITVAALDGQGPAGRVGE